MPTPSFQEWKRVNPSKSINEYYQELSSGKLNLEKPSPTPKPTPTINNIYLQNDNGVQEGPFSFEHLRSIKIDSNILVWFEGMENWMRARDIPQLREVLRTNYIAPTPSPPISSPHIYANQVTSNVEDNYFFQNSFGTITNKRVTFLGKKRFGTKTRVDLATKHITYVELTVVRKIPSGIFFILIGIIPIYLLLTQNGFFLRNIPFRIPVMCICAFIILKGIYNIIGGSFITINTAGLDRRNGYVPPNKKKEATTFVSELRNVLFG